MTKSDNQSTVTHAKAKGARCLAGNPRRLVRSNQQILTSHALYFVSCDAIVVWYCIYSPSFMCAYVLLSCASWNKSAINALNLRESNACHWSTTTLQLKFHKEPESGRIQQSTLAFHTFFFFNLFIFLSFTPLERCRNKSLMLHSLFTKHNLGQTDVPRQTEQSHRTVQPRISTGAVDPGKSIFIFNLQTAEACVWCGVDVCWPVSVVWIRNRTRLGHSFNLCLLWLTGLLNSTCSPGLFSSTSHFFHVLGGNNLNYNSLLCSCQTGRIQLNSSVIAAMMSCMQLKWKRGRYDFNFYLLLHWCSFHSR